MAAVRVPPSASMTSQSIQSVRSPRSSMSTMARIDRPISRWISLVRPSVLPERSRGFRLSVEAGSIPYSAVIHPCPFPSSHWGTECSMLTVQRTRVSPNETRTDPGVFARKRRWNDTGRSWSAARPSDRGTFLFLLGRSGAGLLGLPLLGQVVDELRQLERAVDRVVAHERDLRRVADAEPLAEERLHESRGAPEAGHRELLVLLRPHDRDEDLRGPVVDGHLRARYGDEAPPRILQLVDEDRADLLRDL